MVHNLQEQRAQTQHVPFVSDMPVVRLVNAFAEPYNNAVATARTCYAPRVITSKDVMKDAAACEQRDAIAQSTYEAGHHTTLQHATFQFVIENISRQCVWSFLHAHPFYNSEQVSQRYVAVKSDKVVVPALSYAQQTLYEKTVAQQMQCYAQLVSLLTHPVQEEYFRIFPARKKHASQHAGAVKKKAQEVARYALPIGTFAHLYHTVSGLTLHRYHRLCGMWDVPTETRYVVQAMVHQVHQHDPLFFARIEDPLPLEDTLEYAVLTSLNVPAHTHKDFIQEFDGWLAGKASRLVDYKAHTQKVMAQSVRTVLGLPQSMLSDEEAIAYVLSPQRHAALSGALNLTSMGKLSRAMLHGHYTFQKKLSHAADSQDQRHRMTPGTRPVLHTHYVGGEPDLVVPNLIERNQEALDVFMHTMRSTWHAIDALLDQKVPHEMALYLLPNAFPVRFEESGDLAAWHHKWTTRLCYNAQDEIWRASLCEIEEISSVHPLIAKHILPPCGLRKEAGLRPLCPEGNRFCGVPVWKLQRDQYQRVL